MIERIVFTVVMIAVLAVGSPSAAQPEDAQERAARERRLVQEGQRALAADSASLERELAEARGQLERSLTQAREELARSVAEISRLSAQMTEPATREMVSLVTRRGGNSVLGVNVDDTDLGALVAGVSPGGPAATAGVAVGDTIVAINDVELGRAAGNGDWRPPTATLLQQMAGVAPGEEVELRVLRDGDYRDVAVRAGPNARVPFVLEGSRGLRLDGGRTGPMLINNAWTGLIIGPWSDVELVSLTPGLGEYFGVDEGLLVIRAGRAAELGMRDGDVIIDIGGREPQSAEHALRIIQSFEPGESLQAAIMRQRRRESLAITVPSAAAQTDVAGGTADLRQLEGQLTELRQRYAEGHPDVVSLRRRIETLKAQGR